MANVSTLSAKRALIDAGVAMVGWIAFSYFPRSKASVLYLKLEAENSLLYFKEITERSEPETAALINQAVTDINSHQSRPVRMNNIKMFHTSNLFPNEVYHVGSSRTRAMIWLPLGTRPNANEVFHYHCTLENSLDLADFSILSPKAIKFLIARQILYVEDDFPLWRCLTGIALIGLGSVLRYLIQQVVDTKKALTHINLEKTKKNIATGKVERFNKVASTLSRKVRIASAINLALLSYPLYRLITASISTHLESQTHDKLAKLGPDYVEGGKEYYEKFLTCNKYHRTLFGTTNTILPSGDYNQGKYSVFNRELAVTDKFNYFVQKELELQQSQPQ